MARIIFNLEEIADNQEKRQRILQNIMEIERTLSQMGIYIEASTGFRRIAGHSRASLTSREWFIDDTASPGVHIVCNAYDFTKNPRFKYRGRSFSNVVADILFGRKILVPDPETDKLVHRRPTLKERLFGWKNPKK